MSTLLEKNIGCVNYCWFWRKTCTRRENSCKKNIQLG